MWCRSATSAILPCVVVRHPTLSLATVHRRGEQVALRRAGAERLSIKNVPALAGSRSCRGFTLWIPEASRHHNHPPLFGAVTHMCVGGDDPLTTTDSKAKRQHQRASVCWIQTFLLHQVCTSVISSFIHTNTVTDFPPTKD